MKNNSRCPRVGGRVTILIACYAGVYFERIILRFTAAILDEEAPEGESKEIPREKEDDPLKHFVLGEGDVLNSAHRPFSGLVQIHELNVVFCAAHEPRLYFMLSVKHKKAPGINQDDILFD